MSVRRPRSACTPFAVLARRGMALAMLVLRSDVPRAQAHPCWLTPSDYVPPAAEFDAHLSDKGLPERLRICQHKAAPR